MNSQRAAAAVQLIHIGAGFIQQAGNFNCRLRVILATSRNVEEQLMPIATRAGRRLDICTGLQRQTHALHIPLSHQVYQRNRSHLTSGSRGSRHPGAAGFHHAALLQQSFQLGIVPLGRERPAGHALFQILITILEQERTHGVVVRFLTQLAEWSGGHDSVPFPRRHAGIRVCSALQQGASHSHARGGRAGIHETHQQAQRRIPHIAQLLPVYRAGVYYSSTLQQGIEQIFIRIHTGGLQRGKSAGRDGICLPALQNAIQQGRHFALPAPLASVDSGVFLDDHGVIVRVIRGAHICNAGSPGQ